MHTCSHCSFEIDTSLLPLPPRCPRCGTSTQTEDASGSDLSPPPLPSMGEDLPPPPGFGSTEPDKEPSERVAKTIFGMPKIQLDDELPAAGQFDVSHDANDELSFIPPPSDEMLDPHRGPEIELDRSSSPGDLDLPDASAIDLPSPGDLDLPPPTDLDLPAPARAPTEPKKKATPPPPPPAPSLPDPSDLDLPIPSRPSPPSGPTPGAPPPQTAKDSLPSLDDLDLEREQPGVVPPPLPAANLIDAHDPPPEGSGTPATSSAARRSLGQGPSRAVVYGGIATLVLVAGLAGSYSLGLFDSPPPAPTAKRGAPKPPPPKADSPPTPKAELRERSEAVFAAFDRDSPEGYRRALELSEGENDPVGQAESALLLHLRYGPDPVRLGQAQTLLKPYVKQEEPHVQRVLALFSLLDERAGESEEVLKQVAGEDPRSQLYRAWIHQKGSKHEEASQAVRKVLATRGGDRAAIATAMELALQNDRGTALQALRDAAEAKPDQPYLRSTLIRALRDAGLLAEASRIAAATSDSKETSAAHRALALAQRAELASDRGNFESALQLFEEARKLAPDTMEVELSRIRVLLLAKRFSELELTLKNFREKWPKSTQGRWPHHPHVDRHRRGRPCAGPLGRARRSGSELGESPKTSR